MWNLERKNRIAISWVGLFFVTNNIPRSLNFIKFGGSVLRVHLFPFLNSLRSCFMQHEFVMQLKAGKPNKFKVEYSENYLWSDKIFIGTPRNSLQLLFDNGDTNQEQCNKFLDACFSSQKTSFLYVWKWLTSWKCIIKLVPLKVFHSWLKI